MARGDLLFSIQVTNTAYIYRFVNDIFGDRVPAPLEPGGEANGFCVCVHPITGNLYSSAGSATGNGIYERVNNSWQIILELPLSMGIGGITFDNQNNLYIGGASLSLWDGSSLSDITSPTNSFIEGLTWDWSTNELIAVSGTVIYRRDSSGNWIEGPQPHVNLNFYVGIGWDVVTNELVIAGNFNESIPLELKRYRNNAWIDDSAVLPFNGLNALGICYDPSNPEIFEPSIDRLEYTSGSDNNAFHIYLDTTEELLPSFGNQLSNLRVITFIDNNSGDDEISIGVTNDFSSLFEQEGIIDVVLEDTYIRFNLDGSDTTDTYSYVSSVGNDIVSEGNPAPATSEAYVRLSLYLEYQDIEVSSQTPLPTISTQVVEYSTTPPLQLSDFNSSDAIDFRLSCSYRSIWRPCTLC